MTRRDLTPDDMNKLADVDALSEEIERDGWPFRGRRLHRVSLAGLSLKGAEISDTEFESVDISGATFDGTRFEDVEIRECDLSESRFHEVRFKNCTLEDVKQHGGYYRRCTFDDVRTANLKFKAAALTGCQLKEIKDSRSYFEDTNFSDSRFTKSDLRETDFVGGLFEGSGFSDSSLERARFSEIGGTCLDFEKTELKRTGLDTISELDAVRFSDCELEQPGLSNVSNCSVQVQDCDSVNFLALRRSELEGLVIKGCEKVANLRAVGTRFTDLCLDGNHFEMAEIRDCEISGSSVFDNCVFEGASLAGTTAVELKIQNSRFEKFIVLEGTHFKWLRLTGVSFGPGFEVDSEGVVYENSDRFPG